MPTYYSGIDLHKRTSYLVTVDEEGSVVKEGNLKNHPASISAYFASMPGKHKAVVESTFNWYWLADLLRVQNVSLELAHAKYLKAITYAKVKTDKVDAATMAQLLRIGMIPCAHQISPELRDARDVLRGRLRLVQKRVAAANAIKLICAKFNVTDVAKLPPLCQLQADCYAQQVALLTSQIKQLEKSLHPVLLPDPDIQRLLRIPGIGKINAFTLLLEIDGIERFPSEKQFFSYCRLVPGAQNSASQKRSRPSKDGNKYLKLAFSHTGTRAIQYYKEIKDFYRAKRRKKHEAVARAIVAKELARIVYHVLSKQTDFNGKFKGVQLTRQKSLQWPLRASPTA